MRDAVLLVALLAIIFKSLRHPWIGVLGWTWVSLMNPHKLSWHLEDMPVAFAMAAATLIGVMVTKDRRTVFLTRESVVFILFMVWMCVTLPFSVDFEGAFPLWLRIMKIDFMILVALAVLHTRRHIIGLAWVLAGSIGFYGVKGGIFTLATGGSYRVWGPDGTYIAGNNEVALAFVLVIPLMRFLQCNLENRWARRGLTVAMLLLAVSALGSHSRGALLALIAMALVFWWRSDRKLVRGVLLVGVSLALVAFMPSEWSERMETIGAYQEDASANGRINAWVMAYKLASDRFFGGGFSVAMPEMFAKYAPDPTDIHAAHSIYFMVLGEHGFIGLFLFCLLWLLVWRSAGRLRKAARLRPETAWLSDLGSMAQVSLAGYAVGGAFLSLSYYDLPYNVMVLVILGNRWIEKREWVAEAPVPTLDPAPGIGGKVTA